MSMVCIRSGAEVTSLLGHKTFSVNLSVYPVVSFPSFLWSKPTRV